VWWVRGGGVSGHPWDNIIKERECFYNSRTTLQKKWFPGGWTTHQISTKCDKMLKKVLISINLVVGKGGGAKKDVIF